MIGRSLNADLRKMNICDSGTLTDSDSTQRDIFNILPFFIVE